MNGNFSDGTNGWVSPMTDAPIYTVNDNTITIEKSRESGVGQGNWLKTTSFTNGKSNHKYYVSCIAWTENATQPASISFANSNFSIGTNFVLASYSTTPVRISGIGSPQADDNMFVLRCGSAVTAQGTKTYFKNVIVIDLTKMFGSDNDIVSALGLSSTSEITTDKAIEAFEVMFHEQYYANGNCVIPLNPLHFPLFQVKIFINI